MLPPPHSIAKSAMRPQGTGAANVTTNAAETKAIASAVGECRCADVPTCRCADVPMCRRPGVPSYGLAAGRLGNARNMLLPARPGQIAPLAICISRHLPKLFKPPICPKRQVRCQDVAIYANGAILRSSVSVYICVYVCRGQTGEAKRPVKLLPDWSTKKHKPERDALKTGSPERNEWLAVKLVGGEGGAEGGAEGERGREGECEGQDADTAKWWRWGVIAVLCRAAPRAVRRLSDTARTLLPSPLAVSSPSLTMQATSLPHPYHLPPFLATPSLLRHS